MRKRIYLRFVGLLVILFTTLIAKAQTTSLPDVERFIQSHPVAVNSGKDLDSLANLITHHYPDSLSRIMAAYVWVAKNISYSEPAAENRLLHSATNIDSVLKYKSTVCAGYVNVFALLCEKAGIVCREIDGFGRTGTQSFANARFAVNHAWAAIWLNGKWNLTDPTWGSGYTLDGTQQFIRSMNDYYFFIEPQTFILDHYPKKPEWQLLKDTVSWEQFISYPGICLGAKENEVSNCSPMQSLIRTTVGSRIEFSFVSQKPLQSIVIYSKQKGFQEKGLLQKKNNTYTYTYTIPATGEYDLLIDLNNYDITKPGTYSSLIDFVYFVEASEKEKQPAKLMAVERINQ